MRSAGSTAGRAATISSKAREKPDQLCDQARIPAFVTLDQKYRWSTGFTLHGDDPRASEIDRLSESHSNSAPSPARIACRIDCDMAAIEAVRSPWKLAAGRCVPGHRYCTDASLVQTCLARDFGVQSGCAWHTHIRRHRTRGDPAQLQWPPFNRSNAASDLRVKVLNSSVSEAINRRARGSSTVKIDPCPRYILVQT